VRYLIEYPIEGVGSDVGDVVYRPHKAPLNLCPVFVASRLLETIQRAVDRLRQGVNVTVRRVAT
jgi:hypothetical protein